MTSATNSQAEELFEKAGVPQGSQALASLHWVVECAKPQFHELSLRPMTTVLQQFEGVLFILEVLTIHDVWRSGTVQISGEVARKVLMLFLFVEKWGIFPFCDLSYNGNVEEFFQKNLEFERTLVSMLFTPPTCRKSILDFILSVQRDSFGLIIDLFWPTTLNGLVDSANMKAQI